MGNENQRDQIFREILMILEAYLYDKYNNYVLQKILEIGSPAHKVQLYDCLAPYFKDIIYRKYASRVVQKMLEVDFYVFF